MKVGVVGAGLVGSAAAYAMGLRGVATEIVLVDINRTLADAQALDIEHAMPFASGASVSSGDYDDMKGAEVVVIAAGVSQAEGESRPDMLGRNARVFSAVIDEIMRVCPTAILVIATNPVDIMTHVAKELSGMPPTRVIGTGTILDSARFRVLLGRHLRLSPRSIHANVLGEHGDSQVLAWSGATAGAIQIDSFAAQIGAPITDAVRSEIEAGTRNAANAILSGKGAVYYGIGAGLARIVAAIRQDEQVVLSVSIVTPEVEGVPLVALSIPRVVGREGVTADLFPDLDPAEHKALERSAHILKDTFQSVRL